MTGPTTEPRARRRGIDPLLAVVVVVAAGIATLALHRLRAGMYLIAGGLALGALLRLLLRPRAAGSLVVRSRYWDVVVLAALAVAIVVLATVTPLAGGTA